MTWQTSQFQTVGTIYRDFKVTRAIEISELQCSLIELIHEPTGAKVMHIPSDDPENLFCLSFQTLPNSSNGVAHILEHTVLCGSKKFPVKDPFFSMQRRSLNTFMNALTGSDFTCYPAATQVEKDFYNLLDVYLDAVFHPNLDELSFLQEGHRLEFTSPDDPNSPLEYKGVVFNEMKGAMASANARLHEAVNKALFPDITYGINSGGDPKNIPELSYQELLDFHREYYHPSRCLFFFYGNLPLEGHLDFISKNTLEHAKKMPPLPEIPLQPRFKKPKQFQESYPIPQHESTEDKTQIAFGWLTCKILEQKELLALSVIEIFLMDTDASPLKRALLNSGLCKQVSCYIDCEITEIPMVITAKGTNPESADQLEQLIQDTLKTIIEEGIPNDLMENAIHQLEFYRSEITGDHAPFGLSLFMRSALLKQHGGDPELGLQIHALFDELRASILNDPNYLTDLIKKHFINNTHFIRVVMTPDKELANQELLEEKTTLENINEALTPGQKAGIIANSKELYAYQKSQEEADIEILPKVSLKDTPLTPRVYPLTQEKIGHLEVFHHRCFTNEIIYADLVFDLPEILEEDLSYVRLFSTLLTQMGCGGRGWAKNLEYIQAYTGGVNAFTTLNLQASDHNLCFPSFYIRGKALHRNSEKLFQLIQDLAISVDFTDISRLKETVLKQYTGLQSSLNSNALKYAINLSARGLNVPSKIANAWYGLDYFWKIKEIADHFDSKAEFLVDKLQELQQKLLCLDHPQLVITSDRKIYETIKEHKFYGLQSLPTKPFPKWSPDYPLSTSYSHARLIASPIAFTGKVIKTVSYRDPDAPALSIAAFLLDNLSLHTAIREKGGAYGGGAVCNTMSGNFYFFSYRDPNIVSTLSSFEKAVKDLIKNGFSDTDLEEAKLEMIQALDTPISPGTRGDLAYGWIREGKTIEIRQAFRNRVVNLTSDEVISAVKNYLAGQLSSATTIVFAGRDLVTKENAKLLAKGAPQFPLENV